jgi:hypothetical protein
MKFEDISYNAIVHVTIIITVRSEIDAESIKDQLLAAFKRKEVIIINMSFYRIFEDTEWRESIIRYHEFSLKMATAKIEIDRFYLDNPNQSKSLCENLIEKLFQGEKATAFIGHKFNIPVRVIDKVTKNIILDEFYYFSIEQLISIS